MFISISEASIFLGCSISTLRRWDNTGVLKATRTHGGHRRYDLIKLRQMFGVSTSGSNRINVGYSRVSSSDQKEDLVRQSKRLEIECQKSDHPYEIISDLGSGLNFKKKGLIA